MPLAVRDIRNGLSCGHQARVVDSGRKIRQPAWSPVMVVLRLMLLKMFVDLLKMIVGLLKMIVELLMIVNQPLAMRSLGLPPGLEYKLEHQLQV